MQCAGLSYNSIGAAHRRLSQQRSINRDSLHSTNIHRAHTPEQIQCQWSRQVRANIWAERRSDTIGPTQVFEDAALAQAFSNTYDDRLLPVHTLEVGIRMPDPAVHQRPCSVHDLLAR